MPLINLIMFVVSVLSMVGLKLSGHSDPATDQILSALAFGSVGAHAGASGVLTGGSK